MKSRPTIIANWAASAVFVLAFAGLILGLDYLVTKASVGFWILALSLFVSFTTLLKRVLFH